MIGAPSLIASIGGAASSIAKSPTPAPATLGETNFTDMLGRVAQEGAATLKQGEAASLAGISGKLPVQDVVQSVMTAERSLQTAIAVRDKLVLAWQDVSRMAI